MTDKLNMGFNFDNSYLKLPSFFYDKDNLNPVKSPSMVIFNDNLAKILGLNVEEFKTQYGVSILAGNEKAQNGAYISQAYAGHQFGYFTMLGDGRAVLIGEQITPSNDRYDIQLKGSGVTKFSRGGDGRAVLGPMLREYIISEAMNGFGIPTTRSLSVVETGEAVYRHRKEKGAILTRISLGHIRVGTFEYARNFGDKKLLKALADYTIKRHYQDIEDDNKYLEFLKRVVFSQAKLIAKWQSVGFIHGVMNTDNMSVCGETIDYGPCAFMDVYNPDTVFSSIDSQGRYRYKNQPIMANWNLCRLGDALIPLVDENEDKALDLVQNCIDNFTNLYNKEWLSIMTKKIGIFEFKETDMQLIQELLKIMEEYKEDFTNTFVSLTYGNSSNSAMYQSHEFDSWHNLWNNRLSEQNHTKEQVFDLMKETNPTVIPRNHVVEEVLEKADNGDYSPVKMLVDIVSNPYGNTNIPKKYMEASKHTTCYKTYCGT